MDLSYKQAMHYAPMQINECESLTPARPFYTLGRDTMPSRKYARCNMK